MRESELPVCRTRGMNLVAAVLGEVSNHYIKTHYYKYQHYNTHSGTTTRTSALLILPCSQF